MKKQKIIISLHKESKYPLNEIFYPIHVGKKNSRIELNIQGDDSGENISDKNPNYCELTAQYWIWKNIKDLDFVGFCHYRRYFNFEKYTNPFQNEFLISTNKFLSINFDSIDLEKEIGKNDIILPKPIIYPFSLHRDYCYAHIKEDLLIVENIIKDEYPVYYKSFINVFYENNKFTPYNMFITRYSIFEDYSKWLFELFEKVEKRILINNYSNQARVFGYLSERLLMVYCKKNGFKIKYKPIYFLSDENYETKSMVRKMFNNIRNQIFFNCSKLFRIK